GGDQFFGSLRRALAALEVFLDDLVQVIDGIEVDIVQLAYLRFDIAWYGDIDHEDRLVSALLQRALHRALAEDRQLAGGGADDDVAVDQLVRNVREQHRVRTELLGQLAGTLQGAVGDDDALDALVMQVTRHQADGLTGARSEEHTSELQSREN